MEEVEEKNTGSHSAMGGHQSLQSCCQRDRSAHSLEELGKHVREIKNAQTKIFLIQKLMNLKLKEGQSIAEHLNDFEGMIARLSVAGLSLDDET